MTRRHGRRIVAIANNKGGVGKSSTADNLGHVLADRGYTVVVVDLDDQANLSRRYKLTADTAGETDIWGIDTVIRRRLPLPLHRTLLAIAPGLNLVPAGEDLGDVADDMTASQLGVLRLRTALHDFLLANSYVDYILLDCPPNLGALTYSALVAADAVIIPTQMADWSLAGVGRVLAKLHAADGVDYLRAQVGEPPIQILGMLACMFDMRIGDQTRYLERVQSGQEIQPTTPPLLGVIPRREGVDAAGQLRQAYEPVADAVVSALGKEV